MFVDGYVVNVNATSEYKAKEIVLSQFEDEYDEDDINFIEVNGITINQHTRKEIKIKLENYEIQISTTDDGYEADFASDDEITY
jgi:hypothetical protein